MTQADAGTRVAVVGAGVVGMTTALALQQRGLSVTVLDPQGPGEGTSSGNAGFLATELIDPLSTPAMLRKAPRLWLDPHGAVALPLLYLLRLLPWLARFVAAARAQKAHLQRWGHEVEWLEAAEIRAREPGLSGALSHGLYFPDAHQVRDPLVLVRRLAKAFEARGGEIHHARVERLVPTPNGVELETSEANLAFDQVVVAAGAWSHQLAKGLGLEVPLETERGYHLTLPERRQALRQPVGSAERRCVMTPMSCGLRVVGFTELGGLSLSPVARRYDSLRRHAGRLLEDPEGLDASATEWMGFRSTLPDSLPVIDTHPSYPTVHFAFGHQHLGLTQAAVTAELVSALVMREPPALDLAPYRVARFRRRRRRRCSCCPATAE